jgi:glycosyltransferase involved in cell wall biosynthesis
MWQERGRTTLRGHARFIRDVAAWCRRQKTAPSVVHLHNMPDYLYLGVLTWHRLGVRMVVDVHDIMSELAVHRFHGVQRRGAVVALRAAEDWVWGRADHLITVHELYAERLIGRGVPEDKVTVVLNAPDPEQVDASMRRTPPTGRTKIVFHGTVTKRSGVAQAVRAMPRVLSAVPEAELVVIGTGDAEEEVRRLIAQLALEEHVRFVNRCMPLTEVVREIADAHVGVVPTERSAYTDGMLPVKLTEYAALGIPAVATGLPLVQQYFGQSSAHLIPEPTPELIAQGLILLIQDRAYRERLTKGAQTFTRAHSWERYRHALRRALCL